MIKRGKTILFLVILLAALLRFYRLGDYPALNADEAAIGYNAYSLIQTGRDEHGNLWPIHFQSFNDYKPGLYFYMVLPFVKLFGLNEWAVRLPGATLGVLSVLIVYLLIDELFKNSKKFLIGEITAFFLAISPWHIHFSRGGWEVNIATFFIVCGVWLFLKALNNPRFYVLCSLFFVLSLYTYHAARILVPLLGLGLLILYWKNLRKNFKVLLVAGVLVLGFVAPLVLDFSEGQGVSRIAGVGLFADPGPLERINEQRGEHNNFLGLVPRLIHNKAVNYGLAFFENWSEHFHGEFLFLSGDEIQRNKVPETGVMYLFDTLFILVGLAAIIKKPNKESLLIVWWLVIAPTAAALTFQSPHALRAQNMVIPVVVISAVGLVSLVTWLKEVIKPKNLLFTIYCLLFTFMVWNFARYEHMYWVHMAKEYPYSSQYGVKELVSYVEENRDKYEKIVVTDRYDQPYILFLFYLKYPPEKFQKEHVLTSRDKYGFSTVRNFDRFVFKSINWDKDRENFPNSLIIGTDEEIPKETNIVKKIYGANDYLYFQIVAN